MKSKLMEGWRDAVKKGRTRARSDGDGDSGDDDAESDGGDDDGDGDDPAEGIPPLAPWPS